MSKSFLYSGGVSRLARAPIVVVVLGALLSLGAASAHAIQQAPSASDYKKAVRLIGTGVARAPDTAAGEPADANWCFDVDIQDVASRRRIGRGTDCLKVVGGDGVGLEVVGTTLFYFRETESKLITQGLTTVQPVLHGSPNYTHITGAIPDDSTNSVISGTKLYRRATGPVRLSGTVDMSEFAGNLGESITFNCLFVLNLKQNGRRQTMAPMPF